MKLNPRLKIRADFESGIYIIEGVINDKGEVKSYVYPMRGYENVTGIYVNVFDRKRFIKPVREEILSKLKNNEISKVDEKTVKQVDPAIYVALKRFDTFYNTNYSQKYLNTVLKPKGNKSLVSKLSNKGISLSYDTKMGSIHDILYLKDIYMLKKREKNHTEQPKGNGEISKFGQSTKNIVRTTKKKRENFTRKIKKGMKRVTEIKQPTGKSLKRKLAIAGAVGTILATAVIPKIDFASNDYRNTVDDTQTVSYSSTEKDSNIIMNNDFHEVQKNEEVVELEQEKVQEDKKETLQKDNQQEENEIIEEARVGSEFNIEKGTYWQAPDMTGKSGNFESHNDHGLVLSKIDVIFPTGKIIVIDENSEEKNLDVNELKARYPDAKIAFHFSDKEGHQLGWVDEKGVHTTVTNKDISNETQKDEEREQ